MVFRAPMKQVLDAVNALKEPKGPLQIKVYTNYKRRLKSCIGLNRRLNIISEECSRSMKDRITEARRLEA